MDIQFFRTVLAVATEEAALLLDRSQDEHKEENEGKSGHLYRTEEAKNYALSAITTTDGESSIGSITPGWMRRF